jgi:hypothetical protein
MASTQNFEQLLEYIVNGEQEKAEELFHSLVVNKSREIYEGLFEEEMKDVDIDEAKCDDDEEMEEAKDDEDDETVEEAFIAFSEEPGGFGGDPTDDMMGDVGADAGDDMDDMDDMDDAGGDDMGGEEGLEDRVMDLEDALDDLKAEFEKLMADEENEPEHNDGEDDPDFGGMDDESEDEGEEEDEKEEEPAESFNFEDIEDIDLSPVEQMREYVEKIGDAYKGGKGVLGSSEEAGTHTKSVVAGKNDMGGTTANIVRGGTGDTKGTKGGLLEPTTKEDNAGNVNVPGGKAGIKHLKNVPAGHGAEKKGKGDGVSVKPFLKPQKG